MRRRRLQAAIIDVGVALGRRERSGDVTLVNSFEYFTLITFFMPNHLYLGSLANANALLPEGRFRFGM